jgi:hypothetical protein
MDLLYISPEFPPNYASFILELDRRGVRVWGLGEADFHSMPDPLRRALRWYQRTTLSDRDAVLADLGRLLEAKAALGSPPRFDLAESHNEHWLTLEAQVNAALGMEGILPADLPRLKKKSAMKALFRACGLPVARGERVESLEHGLALGRRLGYPLILKPDEGVGAGGIHRVEHEGQLAALLEEGTGDRLLEEFIAAPIVTYDGLTDRQGRVLFESTLTYGQGVLECVQGQDTFFYVDRRLPGDLATAGKMLVERFGIRRKFFHFEFFRREGMLLPIEINSRPPGGPILDMMNYSVDGDLYAAWAAVIAGREEEPPPAEKRYHCAYVGRRRRPYRLDHDAVLALLGERLVEHGDNPAIFRQAMGDYRYIFRCEQREELLALAGALRATAPGGV